MIGRGKALELLCCSQAMHAAAEAKRDAIKESIKFLDALHGDAEMVAEQVIMQSYSCISPLPANSLPMQCTLIQTRNAKVQVSIEAVGKMHIMSPREHDHNAGSWATGS